MKKNSINYEGELDLNGLIIPCYVLEDGTRVLSQRELQNSLKMVDDPEDGKQVAGSRLARHLNQKSLQPYLYKDKGIDHYKPIDCFKGDSIVKGYEATILADICDAFLEARKEITSSARQEIIAKQCEVLIRAFAKVGIIALVDEATGYQHEKERNEYLKSITITGLPKDIASAKELARNADKHRVQFQDWIIEFMLEGTINIKKSGDGGFDGYITFQLSDSKRKSHAIIEVKSGNVGIATLRSFLNVVDKQKADMGIFVCFADQVTSGMRLEANSKGSIPNFANCPYIQIITVEDLLDGKMPKLPGHSSFFSPTVYDSNETSAKTKQEIENQGKLL